MSRIKKSELLERLRKLERNAHGYAYDETVFNKFKRIDEQLDNAEKIIKLLADKLGCTIEKKDVIVVRGGEKVVDMEYVLEEKMPSFDGLMEDLALSLKSVHAMGCDTAKPKRKYTKRKKNKVGRPKKVKE